uniref:Uncharacterized protein n=1 Tax=Romanomermis culicivorax TaxID=13658 RepID=A0A915L969_ROMCU
MSFNSDNTKVESVTFNYLLHFGESPQQLTMDVNKLYSGTVCMNVSTNKKFFVAVIHGKYSVSLIKYLLKLNAKGLIFILCCDRVTLFVTFAVSKKHGFHAFIFNL